MEHKFSWYASRSASYIENYVQTSLVNGLSFQDVKTRQGRYGLNILQEKNRVWWEILIRQLSSLFVVTYFLIVIVSLFLQEYQNAFVIFLCLSITVFAGFYQEFKAQKEIQHLKRYLVSYVTVIRDGVEISIPSSQLVPGDIVIITAGNFIPADIRFVKTDECAVDESVFTGESVPTQKFVEELSISQEKLTIFDAKNIGFAGTTVVSGKARGIVFATGEATQLGLIAGSEIKIVPVSNLAKGITRLSRFILGLIFSTIILVFLVQILSKGTENIYSLFVFALALAIGATPEALPIVVTFGLARGARELAKKSVIVKRLSAVEDLGIIEILCSDKTGTLTENTLKVTQVEGESVVQIALLVAEVAYERLGATLKGIDTALWEYADQDTKSELKNYKKIKEIPFDPVRRQAIVVVQNNAAGYEIIVRGMPEEVLKHCAITDHQKESVFQSINAQSQKGYRVIAVAKKDIEVQDFDRVLGGTIDDLQFVGFISFSDPIKKTTSEAIKTAQDLGLLIKILSGDSKQVCGAVAHAVGLISDVHDVITGDEFMQRADKEKENLVKQCHVFARCTPEQKLEIIRLLQKNSVVGYLGDGINDVPALKVADVALVVQEAVDVARDVGDVILLKKSLFVIIQGIAEGRRAVANTMKYIKTTLSANLGNFYSLALASLVLDYLPMLPIQLIVVNLLSDFPMIAISTDTVSADTIRRPSRYDAQELIFFCGIMGAISSMFDIIYFRFFRIFGSSVLQSGWFVESILTEIAFIFSVRSRTVFWKMHPPSIYLVILSFLASIVTILLPATFMGQSLFHFSSLNPKQIFLIILITVTYFLTTEAIKMSYYRFFDPKFKQVRP